jgi:hypothetical protein
MAMNLGSGDAAGASRSERSGSVAKRGPATDDCALPKTGGARIKLAPEVESAVAAVIDAALGSRPLRGAKRYYRNVARHLEDTGFEPPSRGTFERMFVAERKKRRNAMLERSERAAAQMGEIVGVEVAFVPGGPPIARRQCELVVSALTTFRTPGPLDAYRDYLQITSRAGVPSITEADFRALVMSPLFVDNVPHDAMPEWWRKKVR